MTTTSASISIISTSTLVKGSTTARRSATLNYSLRPVARQAETLNYSVPQGIAHGRAETLNYSVSPVNVDRRAETLRYSA